ncbi:oxalate:formate antiporter-like isoform X1 [Elysia marginata]|uniref:Oxalate:formate antiporter-like isoform X1 n=1 Tax=Elysia marginata TaxID=1093978 RepID=A0AAV4G5U3_9GAST|nr:oxalate:formate antiporter-like isoform X1 [Elysia marginata]
MIFASPVERLLGIHLSILIGDILVSVAMLSGYFAIKEPLALTFLYGGLEGFCVGLVYSLMVKLLLQTMPDHGGLANGIMSAGPVFGAVLFVGMSFIVVNPHKAKPDLKFEKKVFFSDKDLINRVPDYFLVMGTMTACFTLIGAALMYFGNRESFKHDEEKARRESITPLNGGSEVQNNCKEAGNHEELPLQFTGARVYSNYIQEPNGETEFFGSIPSEGKIEESVSSHKSMDMKKPHAENDASPLEAIKTRRFWLVWLAYITSNHTHILFLNLYKQYGQRIIRDDKLFVTTGMISNVGLMIVRPLVGAASDKIGIRSTNVYLNASSCIFMCLMVVSLHTFPWFYLVFVAVEFVGVSPHTMLFSLLSAYEFGKTHCASNMGMIRFGNIVIVLLEPLFIDAIVEAIGWDWLFLTGSMASAVATLAIIALDWC